MSDKATIRMLEAYEEIATPTLFLSSLFQSPPRNFYNQAEIEIDIKRSGEPVSIVVQDFSSDGRENSYDLYTNKKFKPPLHKEKATLNAFDLINRSAGNNPFEDINFQIEGTIKALELITKMDEKIRRAIELQASQILQTGKLELKDSTGTLIYVLDYSPKTSHFVTAGVDWDQSSADPIGDLEALAAVIRKDGKKDPDQLIFGTKAFELFVKNEDVQKRYNNRRIDLGTIAPVDLRNNGGTYMGTVHIGTYPFDIWTYNGHYDDPETSNTVPYIADDYVSMRASTGRLDATFGGIPTFGAPDASVLPFLPPRLPSADLGIDLFLNAYLTESKEQLVVRVNSRPLLIPTAIDTFGRIDTIA